MDKIQEISFLPKDLYSSNPAGASGPQLGGNYLGRQPLKTGMVEDPLVWSHLPWWSERARIALGPLVDKQLSDHARMLKEDDILFFF